MSAALFHPNLYLFLLYYSHSLCDRLSLTNSPTRLSVHFLSFHILCLSFFPLSRESRPGLLLRFDLHFHHKYICQASVPRPINIPNQFS